MALQEFLAPGTIHFPLWQIALTFLPSKVNSLFPVMGPNSLLISQSAKGAGVGWLGSTGSASPVVFTAAIAADPYLLM